MFDLNFENDNDIGFAAEIYAVKSGKSSISLVSIYTNENQTEKRSSLGNCFYFFFRKVSIFKGSVL